MLSMTATTPPKPVKSNRERQADFKTRMRATGFQQLNVWVHRDDADALKAFADKLTARRARSLKP